MFHENVGFPTIKQYRCHMVGWLEVTAILTFFSTALSWLSFGTGPELAFIWHVFAPDHYIGNGCQGNHYQFLVIAATISAVWLALSTPQAF